MSTPPEIRVTAALWEKFNPKSEFDVAKFYINIFLNFHANE